MIVRRHDVWLRVGMERLAYDERFVVFNTTWFGLTLLSTAGRDDVVGATRTFSISADDSVTLTEEVRDLFFFFFWCWGVGGGKGIFEGLGWGI